MEAVLETSGPWMATILEISGFRHGKVSWRRRVMQDPWMETIFETSGCLNGNYPVGVRKLDGSCLGDVPPFARNLSCGNYAASQ
jgi:hypothetical protein